MNSLIPAQLWVGSTDTIYPRLEEALKKKLCLHGFQDKQCFCISCKHIGNRQHRSVSWICPATTYTVEDLEPLFHRSSFSLDADEHFFFVLEKAHTLTITTANRLLKILEEPPVGYHFILISNNTHAILPTIRSRCAVIPFAENSTSSHPLVKQFLQAETRGDVIAFEQILAATPHESETQELLSSLLSEFSTRYTTTHIPHEQEYYEKCIDHIHYHSSYLPQPGSAQLFWKHFFLTFPRALQ